MGSSGTFLLITIVLVVPTLAAGMLFYARKNLREAKNYERGLKMVPLLIHLPPSSDDLDSKGRDARDIADETIFKAQTIYTMLASTAKKGFKSSIYGQRHISLEIVAHKGRVYFYTAAPITLVPAIEQAILGAYPTSRLEEVAEHNIFSPVGKSSGTIGGELVLKESAVYPIATYQEIKRDTIQALLNALSSLNDEDGAGVQILLRPTGNGWSKKAVTESTNLRQGKKNRKGAELVFWWIQQIFAAPVKPPEKKDPQSMPEQPTVSGVDQSRAEAIEEKARHNGYEVLIRVVASSNISQRSQLILNNIVAVFSLFDSAGRNGFKFIPAKDIFCFVLAYVLRVFPPEYKKCILNDVELATIFHLPDSSNVPTTQVERQQSKQVDGPRNLLENGLLLGYNEFRGVKKPIRMSDNDRRRHMYVVGQTGTGKSTFLENIALQDMLEGRGFAFVDPHGDTAERLLGMVPKERTEDIIYFCPAEMEYPMGFNLFEFHNPEQKDFIIQEVINMIYKLYDPQRQGIVGPRFEHIFRNCALLLMADPKGGTFIDVPKLLVDPDFMKQKLKYTNDRTVIDFWTKEFPNSQRSNDAGEVTAWVVSKFSAFMSNEMMRNIIGQNTSSFNMRKIMDEGKILLVNLSKGRTGELNSKLLGMIFVMKFQAAAMSRADVSEEERRDFCLYVDEFQNFATDSFESILSEARKFRLNLIVANQFITQLEEGVRDAVFGNIGAVVAHRVGTNDAEQLEKYFRPVFDVDDLQQLPNYNAIVKMLIGGVPVQPFSMADLPYLGHSNKNLADALKQLSGAKHGRPRAVVEKEIFDRLTVIPQPKPAFGAMGQPSFGGSPQLGSGPGGFGSPPPKPPGQGSFLDDWLAKRRAQDAKRATALPTGVPAAPPPTSPFSSANQAPAMAPVAPSAPSVPQVAPPPVTSVNPSPPFVSRATQPQSSPTPAFSPPTQSPAAASPISDPASTAVPIAAEHQSPASENLQTSMRCADTNEVASIAEKLKQTLVPANAPVAAAEQAKIVAKSGSKGMFTEDDTIHIDKEGNFSAQ